MSDLASDLRTIHGVPVLMCSSEGETIGGERDVDELRERLKS